MIHRFRLALSNETIFDISVRWRHGMDTYDIAKDRKSVV